MWFKHISLLEGLLTSLIYTDTRERVSSIFQTWNKIEDPHIALQFVLLENEQQTNKQGSQAFPNLC